MKYNPPFKINNTIINYISQISEIVAKLEMYEYNFSPKDLRKKYLIKTITGTLQLEGNTLDETQITSILEGKRILGSPREISEVKGAIELYENIDDFDYKKLDDILKAHKILMKEILINAGEFRDKNVGIGGGSSIVHIAPPSHRVKDLINFLFIWLKETNAHPLIKSSVFHYEFEFIHPFIDGNGRIGRFWQTLILYNWKPIFRNIPVESLIKENQEYYYNALKKSGSSGECTVFIEFMLEIILDSCENIFRDNDTKKVPKYDPKKRLGKIVELIKEDNNITILQISDLIGVSSKTIKRDIAKLKEKGILKREGGIRAGYWKLLKDSFQ